MKSQDFSIDLMKLKEGSNLFEYEIDDSFFLDYENSPIERCTLWIKVHLDKRFDLMDMKVSVSGHISTSCDRCMADIKLPLQHTEEWYFRKDDAEENPEVEILDENQIELDIKPYIYESSVMAVPTVRVYNCEDDNPKPCDESVLTKLESIELGEDTTTSIWDTLKDLDL